MIFKAILDMAQELEIFPAYPHTIVNFMLEEPISTSIPQQDPDEAGLVVSRNVEDHKSNSYSHLGQGPSVFCEEVLYLSPYQLVYGLGLVGDGDLHGSHGRGPHQYRGSVQRCILLG